MKELGNRWSRGGRGRGGGRPDESPALGAAEVCGDGGGEARELAGVGAVSLPRQPFAQNAQSPASGSLHAAA